MINLLQGFRDSAPKIHMSFAVEPSAYFLNKVVVWLRANINPVILIEVGLQPALAAGCSVRTANKLFDMSLKNRFVDSRPFLIKSIEEISGNMPAETQTPVAQETVEASVTPVAEVNSQVVVRPTERENSVKASTDIEAPTDTKSKETAPAEAQVATEAPKVEAKE